MSESELLELVHRAIGSPIYGNIEWQLQAEARIYADPELQSIKPQGIRALLRQFVLNGNAIEIRRETREWHKEEYESWFRARIPVVGYREPLFVELVLFDPDPGEPWVRIVNAHF